MTRKIFTSILLVISVVALSSCSNKSDKKVNEFNQIINTFEQTISDIHSVSDG